MPRDAHTTALAQAVRQFYQAATKPPYIDADAILEPPPDGWPGVNAEILRARGRSDHVIELLRHLPYLRQPSQAGRRWMLSPTTLAIDYSSGGVYGEDMEERQPTPPHCIWLTAHAGRDGTDLLLDTETNSITEWSMLEDYLMIPYAEYEDLPKQDKWMAYPTMPAAAFFDLWRRRWAKLVWLPVPSSKSPFSALWWHRALPQSDAEASILESDDEYEYDEDDSDSDSGGGDDEADNFNLSDDEVNTLIDDAGRPSIDAPSPSLPWIEHDEEDGGDDTVGPISSKAQVSHDYFIPLNPVAFIQVHRIC
ncbi:hypothetical protein PFICI_03250 [Pestalotiopsis fici W106-1]|uniref:Uncharacterized protein n=1 Tax=Pestalotiopsis fici (strain W106-1 / CGMCC3.15140) TaxID=1229662 RepID=W3XGT4_PESFW|nr:uncharacterized protein PFICI_03250 [Pestalotiopsis fici W106-1]ETS85225.1 hypothetical protein PFICI_03250 [Pestalotiopsis fici W106-1]